MEHYKSTSMLNAVGTHESHQHAHKSKETCCQHENSHEDDDDEESDFSEYSDSEDVPSETKEGYKLWDYFYMLKSDCVKGLEKCEIIFRKQHSMFRTYERIGNELFTFSPTNKVIEGETLSVTDTVMFLFLSPVRNFYGGKEEKVSEGEG